MSTLDRLGVNGDAAVKSPVRAGTTGPVTLNGLQTVDGVALAEGDRVLVKNQYDQSTNGIYSASSGNWPRTLDANGNRDLVFGSFVLINQGSTLIRTIWILTCTDNPIVMNQSLLTWARF